MAMAFLDEALLSETLLSTGTFNHYTPESSLLALDHLVLDSQALEHLEILDSPSTNGSLLSYLDQCRTAFGKRQLKRWLVAPLTDIEKINDRLDAVEDLIRF